VSARATTRGPEGTRSLAAALAELMRPGDLVVLVGDLGTGKTVFTQGVGAGLGVDDQITSPTFALVQSYVGRVDLHHLDVYRLEQMNEALDLGLNELLDDDAVVVIEWGDAIAPVLPQDYLEIRIAYGAADDLRDVELVAVGSSWSARTRALDTVVERFAPEAGDGVSAAGDSAADVSAADDGTGADAGADDDDIDTGGGGPPGGGASC